MLRPEAMCGSNTATHPGPGLFARSELDADLIKIQVSCLDS